MTTPLQPLEQALGINTNRNQEIAYYQQSINKLTGIYEGNNTKYKGQTFPQIYQALLAQYPTESPFVVAQTVLGIYAAARLTNSIQASVNETGTSVGQIAQGTVAGLDSFATPLQFLTSGAFWVRAGEVILGLVLVGVGMVKLAETNGAAKAVVNNTPLGMARKIVK